MGRPDQDLWVPTIPSVPADLEFVSRRRCEDGVMALRFLYLFFLRVGQLIRLVARPRGAGRRSGHASLAGSGDWDDLAAAVIALDVVDRCFRRSGLWPGNIYLAGAETLRVVLDLAEEARLLPRGPEAVLRELAARTRLFVSGCGKFRSGAYDGQIQYRLNGWGRALAGRLAAGEAGAARADAYRRAIARHLARERQVYSSFLSELEIARQDYRGNKLDAALNLPIPVLV